ncbi:hypothetical protein MTO96_037588 [Rhipicephalus appendiculatus]
MDSTSRIPGTKSLADESVEEPRIFLATHPSNLPIAGPSSDRKGEPESAQGVSGAEPLQSLTRGAEPTSGISEMPRPVQWVSEVPRGIRADEKEAAASDPSHRKDDVSRDQMHAASQIRNVEVPDSGQNDVQRAAAAFRSCEDVLNGRVDHLETVKRTLGDAGITWPLVPERVDVLRTLLFTSLKLAWDVLVRAVPRCSGNTTTLTMDPGRHFYRVVEMATNSLSESEFKIYFNTLRKAFGSGRNDENEASLSETAVLDKITSLVLVPKYHFFGNPSPVRLQVPNDVGTDWLATLVHFGYNATNEVALVTENPSFVGAFLEVAALYTNKDLILNYYGGKSEVASVRYTAFCFSTAYLLSRGAPFASYESETVSREARAKADVVMRSVSSAYIRRLSKWPRFKEDIKIVADWLATPAGAFHEAKVIATDDGCHGNGDKFPDLTDSLPFNWHSSSRLISNVADDFYEVVRAISSLQLSVPSTKSKTVRLIPLSLWFPLFDVRLASAINYAGIGGQVGYALSWLLVNAYTGDSRNADVIRQSERMRRKALF